VSPKTLPPTPAAARCTADHSAASAAIPVHQCGTDEVTERGRQPIRKLGMSFLVGSGGLVAE